MNARLLTLVSLALVLAACGGNPAKPDAAPSAAPAAAPAPAATPTTAAPAAEGERVEGVKLTPGVIDIAKKEGEAKLTRDDRIKCEKYKPLGSNRTQYRCTTKEEARQSKEDNAREVRKIQTPPPAAHGTLGQ